MSASQSDAAVATQVPVLPTLGSLSLAILLSALGTSIANVALPTLQSAFDVPFRNVQWVAIAYLLAMTATVVGAGRIGDIFGRRRTLLSGIAVYVAGSALCASATGFWVLVGARAVQGIGAAAMMAMAMALAGDAVPKARTGSAMGLLGTMSAIGTALGPSLGGFLIAAAGWRTVFAVGVPFAFFAFLLVLYALPADRRQAQRPAKDFDTIGAILLAGTLALYALSMTAADGFGIELFAAAIVAAGLFIAAERRAAPPLVDPSIFRAPGIAAGFVANVFVATIMMATLVVGPFHLSRSLELDALQVGMVMSVGPAISIACGVPAGRLVDRLGHRAISAIGLVAMSIGAFVLAAMPAAFGAAGYLAGIAVLTPGYQLFQAANNTAVLKGVAADRRGVVSGLLALSRNLGLVTGASLMGTIYALSAAQLGAGLSAADASVAGTRVVFLVAGVLGVVALVAVRSGRVTSGRP